MQTTPAFCTGSDIRRSTRRRLSFYFAVVGMLSAASAIYRTVWQGCIVQLVWIMV